MEIDEQKLVQATMKIIKDYLGQRKSHTQLSLARKSGVSYATIRRLANGETVPSVYSVLSILDVVLSSQERIEFIDKHFPLIGKQIKSLSLQGASASTDKVDVSVLVNSPTCDILFQLKVKGESWGLKSIEAQYGNDGIAAVSELIAKSILRKKGQRLQFVLPLEELFAETVVTLWMQKMTIKFSERGRLSNSKMSSIYGGVNDQTLKKLQVLHEGMIERAQKLINDPANYGKNHTLLNSNLANLT